VCTTVAIAIVAETCSPFTVLPGLMNEYRVPELNVQNGVLKSLSFLFEYIGEMGKDYIYSVTSLFEDALMDRLVFELNDILSFRIKRHDLVKSV
jgi:splicing factor 3B subunit 1